MLRTAFSVLAGMVAWRAWRRAASTPGKLSTKAKLRVFIRTKWYQPGNELLSFLKSKLDDNVELVIGDIKGNITPPSDVDVYVAHRPSEGDVKTVTAEGRCKLAVVPYAGIQPQSQAILRGHGMKVGNLHHNAGATAEMAMALLLAASKLILPIDQEFRRNDWSSRGLPANPATGEFEFKPTVLLSSGNLVIVGYGHLGKAVARAALGIDMKVTGLRRSLKKGESYEDGRVQVRSASDLLEVLRTADAVIVCCPGTKETEGLIGVRELSVMKSTSVLVNVGRGPVCDAKALYEALKERRIFAAGIDAWYNYPKDYQARVNCPPSDYPFNELDNVVMSPHRGGALGLQGIEHLRAAHLAHGLNCVAKNKPWPTLFDLDRGY